MPFGKRDLRGGASQLASAKIDFAPREKRSGFAEVAITKHPPCRHLVRIGNGSVAMNRIEINPSVLGGKPVIRNTRIGVELLLRKLAEGATIPELLDAYPRLTENDVRACLAYAADTIANEEVYSLSSD